MSVILLNCVTLGMFQPCQDLADDGESQRARILKVLQLKILNNVSFIPFLFLVFGNVKVTKILHTLCLHFARQDGQDGKKPK